MRFVFIGAGEITVQTVGLLIERRHEVVVIEADRDVIDELSDQLDCSFLHGDGSKPDLLRETDPASCDVLFCLSDDDQANLVAALVGRSLGFKRVVPSIQEAQFEPICQELGLEDYIIPSRTMGRYLADMATGLETLEPATALKEEARLFAWTLAKGDAGPVHSLELPKDTKVICYYREGKFRLVDDETSLAQGDEVVILTHSKRLRELRERWQPDNPSK